MSRRTLSEEKARELSVEVAWVFCKPAQQLAEINRLIDEGKLQIHIETVLPLPSVKKAHQLSAWGAHAAKLFCKSAHSSETGAAIGHSPNYSPATESGISPLRLSFTASLFLFPDTSSPVSTNPKGTILYFPVKVVAREGNFYRQPKLFTI